MFIEIINTFHLQLFADAGTLVNATGNYVMLMTAPPRHSTVSTPCPVS